MEAVIAVVFSTALLMLFVQRKRAFVTWEYVYLAYGILAEGLTVIFDHGSPIGVYIAAAEFVIIGLYLYRSTRVKRTFVR